MASFGGPIERPDRHRRLRHEPRDQRGLPDTRLADEHAAVGVQRRLEFGHPGARRRAAGQGGIARGAVSLEGGGGQRGARQVGLVEHHQTREAGGARGTKISIDDEQIGLGLRCDHHHQQVDVGDHRFSAAAQGRALQQRSPRQHLDGVDLAECGIGSAADAVSADRLHAASERACVVADTGIVAHLQMAPERCDHLCVELHCCRLPV